MGRGGVALVDFSPVNGVDEEGEEEGEGGDHELDGLTEEDAEEAAAAEVLIEKNELSIER